MCAYNLQKSINSLGLPDLQIDYREMREFANPVIQSTSHTGLATACSSSQLPLTWTLH